MLSRPFRKCLCYLRAIIIGNGMKCAIGALMPIVQIWFVGTAEFAIVIPGCLLKSICSDYFAIASAVGVPHSLFRRIHRTQSDYTGGDG